MFTLPVWVCLSVAFAEYHKPTGQIKMKFSEEGITECTFTPDSILESNQAKMAATVDFFFKL